MHTGRAIGKNAEIEKDFKKYFLFIIYPDQHDDSAIYYEWQIGISADYGYAM